jgi:O-antigen ligase
VERATALVWAALLAVLFFASIAGADSKYAWIGTPDRRLGWIAWCTFPLMFWCGQAVTSAPGRRVVMQAASVSAVALGVWCVFERAGWSLIGESFADQRVGGPFGQPAYVGAAAVLLVPLALGLVFDRGARRAWRVVGGAGAVSGSAALLLAQTRGAWFGVVLLGARHGDIVRRRWRELAVAAAAVVVLFAVTPLGGRVTDAFDLGRGTTQGRFDDWKVGATVVAHHPGLGVGPEGYRVVFPQVVSAQYVRRHGTEVVPDRAHNGIIDVAVDGGVAAGLLYLALSAFVLARAWRALRSRDPVALALAAAVVAYVVQQQFLFPLSEIDPLFWIVAGMLVASSPSPAPAVTFRRVPRVVVVGVALCVLFGSVLGGREVLADRLLRRAADARGTADLRDADRATRFRSDSIRTWYVAARIAARGPALTDVDAAIARVQRGLRESPRDPALRILNADLLVERAVRSELPDDAARARAVVGEYLQDAANEAQLWLDRAALARLANDHAGEQAALDRAARLRPEPSARAESEKS